MTIRKKLIAHLASLPVHTTSSAKLAKAVGASHGAVTLALGMLVATGELEVLERAFGPGGGTMYRYVKGFNGEAHPDHAFTMTVRQ